MAKAIIVKRRIDDIHNVRLAISKKPVCYGIKASTKSAITFEKVETSLTGFSFINKGP